MREYVFRRLVLAVPTILLVLFASFLILPLLPGDPVEQLLAESPYATEADRDELRERLGLNEPLPVQFLKYVGDIARGDFRDSILTGRPVSDELKNRLPVTAEFALYTTFFATLIAIPIGIVSATRQDTAADYLSRSIAILALSVPYFFAAILIIVFGPKYLSWAPPLVYKGWSDGAGSHLYYFLVPALLLGVNLAAPVMRLTRNMMLEVLRQDYIRTAWSKGLRERVIIVRHSLKNAMIPVVTIIGLQISTALGGSIIIESIFNMPGMGRFLVSAIFERDYPAIQAVVLIFAVAVVFINIAVDLLYGLLDPRIRYG